MGAQEKIWHGIWVWWAMRWHWRGVGGRGRRPVVKGWGGRGGQVGGRSTEKNGEGERDKEKKVKQKNRVFLVI